jgi:hypothetical protein
VRASSGFRKTRKRIPMTVSSMWALMMASSLVTYTRNPRSTYLGDFLYQFGSSGFRVISLANAQE